MGMQSRCQRGLLPLKKRKVRIDDFSASSDDDVHSSSRKYGKGESSKLVSQISLNDSALIMSQDLCSSLKQNSNLGMTALSLVATAAAASAYSVSTSAVLEINIVIQIREASIQSERHHTIPIGKKAARLVVMRLLAMHWDTIKLLKFLLLCLIPCRVVAILKARNTARCAKDFLATTGVAIVNFTVSTT
jgi:hypothetical protein